MLLLLSLFNVLLLRVVVMGAAVRASVAALDFAGAAACVFVVVVLCLLFLLLQMLL